MAETGGQVIPATEYIETPVKEMKKFKESRFTSEPEPRVPTKYDRMNDALDTKPASFSVPRPVVSVEPQGILQDARQPGMITQQSEKSFCF
jgi:hypothetical protein